MHPRIHEYLAEQHREELLREVGFAGFYHAHDRPIQAAPAPQTTRNRRVLAYLLFGSHALAYRYIGQEWLLRRLQTHINASMRLFALLIFALGIFFGSLLGNRFGLAPAFLFSGIVLLLTAMLVLVRSVKLLRAHVPGHS